MVKIGGDNRIGYGLGVVVAGLRGNGAGGAILVVRRVLEALGEALAVRDRDGEAEAVGALVAVVVAREEEGLAFLEEGNGDGDRARVGVGGVGVGPLDGVVVGGVVVVAELVGRGVVRLDY